MRASFRKVTYALSFSLTLYSDVSPVNKDIADPIIQWCIKTFVELVAGKLIV